MSNKLCLEMEESPRETFEGARPGEGTRYPDHDFGIYRTITHLSAEQALQRNERHPGIADHVCHANCHIEMTYE